MAGKGDTDRMDKRGRKADAGDCRRKRGRPRQQLDMRGTILDVAEQFFADRGFEGASMRDIAAAAGANQSLIRYYFNDKETLFDTVLKRRGMTVSSRRHELLDEILADGAPPTVRTLIRAYLLPQWEIKASGPGGEAFVRLQARLHTEPAERSFRIRREIYDASAKRYLAALTAALPQIDPADVSWRLAFTVGAYLFMLSGVDRLGDLSDGRFRVRKHDEVIDRLVVFLEAGMSAPSTYH